jgi:riboflavin kinase/FMN adenylyltransferase
MGQPSCVVVLAAFDGLHLGHRALMAAGVDLAARRGTTGPVAVVVDRPDPDRPPLASVPARVAALTSWGAASVEVLAAHHDDPRRLNDEIVATLGRLGADWLVLGCPPAEADTSRWPSVAWLRPGYRGGLVELPRPVTADGTTVSSAAVVARLQAGDAAGVAELLGHPWSLSGTVVTGDRRGRTLGFPTANLPTDGTTAVPADGVYAGWLVRADGTRLPAAVNFGRRPTFYEGAAHPLLEAHVLDADVDLYGEAVRVELVERLRGERRFAGIDALRAQLVADCDAARRALAG